MELKKLTNEEENIIIKKGTEVPFSGKYDNFHDRGVYACKRCGASLYRSDDKFDAKCGWPSFDDEVKGAIKRTSDADGERTEISCKRCGAHLGHVFEGEGMTWKNVRHCVNSVSMEFIPEAGEMGKKETAYLAGGCFWCTEAIFKKLKGVLSVMPGYSGGTMENPTYDQVSAGTTGHAETAKIEFDPLALSYEGLLEVFFGTHDPTSVNKQGDDIGPQYRSIIFYENDDQKEISEKFVSDLNESKIYSKPIVTEIKKFERFYEAEDYHKNYYEHNKDKPYCQLVIAPKLKKLSENYKNFIK